MDIHLNTVYGEKDNMVEEGLDVREDLTSEEGYSWW